MIRINLLPQAERKKGISTPRGGIYVIAGLILLLAVLGLLWFNLKMEISELNKEIASTQTDLIKYQTIAKEVEKYKGDKKSLEDKLASIERLKAGQVGPVHMLEEVSQAVPREIWLTSMHNTASRLVIQGLAFSNFAIADFMTKLAKLPSGRFTDVDLSYSEHTMVEKVPVEKFEITCNIKF